MIIKSVTIKGIRGFSEQKKIEFAIPDRKNRGSGLTVMVGPNNSGKSTVIETIHLINSSSKTVNKTMRNEKCNGKVFACIEDYCSNITSIESSANGGSFIVRKKNSNIIEYTTPDKEVFILSSKRGFTSTFNTNLATDRNNYGGNITNSDYRNTNNYNNSNFGGRLLAIDKNRQEFEECLGKVLNPIPNWTIESENENNSYLEFSFNDVKHNSSGAGDGFINIFNIVDALYDSKENNVIIIDEPEISLHPDLQRKLFDLFVEYSVDKQIIISTHSPYFVDWELFTKNGKILRFKKTDDCINIFELSEETKEGVSRLLTNKQNPHILSLNSNEIFFLNDNVILTEGQDDVLCYKHLLKENDPNINCSFFGWGAGGAGNVKYILNMLRDLGYQKVFTIFDGDKKIESDELEKTFKDYCFFVIDANDVRNKKDEEANKILKNLLIQNFSVEVKDRIKEVIDSLSKSKDGLFLNLVDFEINPKFNNCVNLLLKKIHDYFYQQQIIEHNKCDKVEDGSNDLSIVNSLLDKYYKANKIDDFLLKKYPLFDFGQGGSSPVAFKKVKENEYCAIQEDERRFGNDYRIIIMTFIKINILKHKLKIMKRVIVKNTLPISWFKKTLDYITTYFDRSINEN